VRTALLLALAFAGSAQAPPDLPVPPVQVDAVVEDKQGRPIDTLRAEDFEVVENGAARVITSVQFVKADGLLPAGESPAPIESFADEQFQAARTGTRLFAIFLDEYHVGSEAAALARAHLAEFVERRLGPRDLVMVVKPLDSLLTLRVTRDRAAILDRIAGFEGRKGEYEPRSVLETSLFAGDRARADAVRVQVVISALHAMSMHLGRLNAARKSLVFVSEGFQLPARRRGEGALPTVEAVVRTANRAAVSMYALDPRALGGAAIPATDDHAVLTRLAADTDGMAMTAPTAVKSGFERAVRDLSGHYVLTLDGTDHQDGGKFHPVEVRVRRPGVSVRARKGYWSATPDDLFRVTMAERARRPPPPAFLPRRASPLIRPWFGLTRDAAGNPAVHFVWEPADRVPGERGRATPPARIQFKAVAPDGTTIFEGAARPAAATLGPADLPARLVFPAPPGRIRIEMAIQDATTRVVDTDVRDVMVRPLAGPLALSTPQVLRSRTAREHGSLGDDPEAVPVASRQFSRLERLWIRVAVYGGGDEPELAGRLLSTIGGAMRPLAIQSTAVAGVHQIDLPLAGLAAGEYSVEFAASGSGRDAKETVTFRVTP
jgi:VWFA-related protein